MKEQIANILKDYTKKKGIMASHVILEDYAEQIADNGFVKVTRCKDCIFYAKFKGCEYNGNQARFCIFHSAVKGENDFCSDGVNEKNENEL